MSRSENSRRGKSNYSRNPCSCWLCLGAKEKNTVLRSKEDKIVLSEVEEELIEEMYWE